jgi:hypothetical protein
LFTFWAVIVAVVKIKSTGRQMVDLNLMIIQLVNEQGYSSRRIIINCKLDFLLLTEIQLFKATTNKYERVFSQSKPYERNKLSDK